MYTPELKYGLPGYLEIDDEASVAIGAILYTQGKITIGKKAVISQEHIYAPVPIIISNRISLCIPGPLLSLTKAR